MEYLDLAERTEKLGDEMVRYTREMGTRDFKPKSSDDVLKYVREKEIDSVYLWFSDILGAMKAVPISSTELGGAFNHGHGFDGSSIEGYQRIHESDMIGIPIPETARVLPFRIGHAKAISMFLDVRHARSGKEYEGDPRHILERNLEEMTKRGFERMNIGPEAEFYYSASPTEMIPIGNAGYYGTNDPAAAVKELTILGLKAMQIPVEYNHTEVGPGQQEIDLKYTHALEMADRLLIHKWLVKEIARRCGIHATFMPKPIEGKPGSGMHIHVSLWKGGKNAFYDPQGPYQLSKTAQSFLEGILHNAREITVITNPEFNSYKRLVPGFEAPVYIAWAADNRSALIRVPENKQGNETATRIEIRFPDPTCNPYLAASVLLSAGLDGIDRKLTLRQEQKDDLYRLDPSEREERGIASLPHSLYSALQAAKTNNILEKTIGAESLRKFRSIKIKENDKHRQEITPHELRQGLRL